MKNQILLLRLVALTTVMALSSCDGNLERNEAKEEIAEWFKTKSNPNWKCTFRIRKSWASDYGSNGGFCSVRLTNPPMGDELKMFNFYFDRGLLFLQKEIKYKDCAYWTINTVHVTDIGKEYLLNQDNDYLTFLSATFNIDEVTGVLQEKDAVEATVDYKIKRDTITPFGEFFEQNCFDIKKNYIAHFTKYDDGWRMK